MKQLKIVCGFTNIEEIRKKLIESAQARGYGLEIIHRYRKEGVLQYINENHSFHTIILQEILQQSSPYTAEDLAALTDERNVNVIVSLDPNHYGNEFMRTIYTAGIMNALFDKDAYADQIIDLIIKGRSRKEARKYYGIENRMDAEKEMELINEDKMERYLNYLYDGPYEECESRYEFVASQLSPYEHLNFIKQLPPQITKLLVENETYLTISSQNIKNRKIFHFNLPNAHRKKIIEKDDTISIQTSINQGGFDCYDLGGNVYRMEEK